MSDSKQQAPQYSEPWNVQDEYLALRDATGRIVAEGIFSQQEVISLGAPLKRLRRIVACVNACAGIPSEVLEAEGIRVLQPNPGEGGQAETEPPEGVASGNAPRLPSDIEAVVERVLAKHGILPAPEKAAPAHVHTMSCYDDGGEQICGGAQ